MNTRTDKQELIEWISELTDQKTLEQIKILKAATESKTDFWQNLPAEVKQAIKEGKTELDKGKGIPHNRVMAEVKERFFK